MKQVLNSIANLALIGVAVTVAGCGKKYATAIRSDEPISRNSVVKVDGRSGGRVCQIYIDNFGQRIAEFTLDRPGQRLMRRGVIRIAGQNFIDLWTETATGAELRPGDFIPAQSEIEHVAKKWSGRALTLVALAVFIVAIAVGRFLLMRSAQSAIPILAVFGLSLLTAYVAHPLVLPAAKRIEARVQAHEGPVMDQKLTPQPSTDTRLGKIRGDEEQFLNFLSTPTDAARLGAFLSVFLISLPIFACLVGFVFRKIS